EEELEAEFAKLAEQNAMDVAKVKELLPVNALKGDLATQKAVDFIKENAKPAKKRATRKKKEEAEETADAE
ncbi:MAG: trigger factor, partial [Clostridia bacterium]|nr:trigger factor [Clostridia bacterium]